MILPNYGRKKARKEERKVSALQILRHIYLLDNDSIRCIIASIYVYVCIASYLSLGGKKNMNLIQIQDIYSDLWKIDSAVDLLKSGGVGVICTDTCYSFVTSIHSQKGTS